MKDYHGDVFGIRIDGRTKTFTPIKRVNNQWIADGNWQVYPITPETFTLSYSPMSQLNTMTAAWSDLKISNQQGFEEARGVVTGDDLRLLKLLDEFREK